MKIQIQISKELNYWHHCNPVKLQKGAVSNKKCKLMFMAKTRFEPRTFDTIRGLQDEMPRSLKPVEFH